MRSLREIFQQFPAVRERGLDASEVQTSLQQFGSNRLTPLPREPLWKKFLEKFDEPIIIILLVASLLKIVVDIFKIEGSGPTYGGGSLGLIVLSLVLAYGLNGKQWIPSILFALAIVLVLFSAILGHPSIEGIAVMVAVVLATGVSFFSEYKSDREFEALNQSKDAAPVKVIRGGEVQVIPLDEVVVGDWIQLEMGDEVPADGRLIKATELMIDQSLLTGESEPVAKKVRPEDDTSEGPEQPGCVYRGTQVVDGMGAMIATEVGDATMIGQIAKRLSGDSDDDEAPATEGETEEQRIKRKLTISKELTPLQLKLVHLAGQISRVGYIAAIAIFLALLTEGILQGQISFDKLQNDTLSVVSKILDYFVVMVIIIVVAVPEGLPMSVTVSLALAMRKMTRANSLVRQLVACETIGSATVICSDKTGTLTQNKMTVVRLGLDGQTFDRGSDQWPQPDAQVPWPRAGTPIDWIVLNAAVNSTANLEVKNGKVITVGNTTEGSLLQWLREAGISFDQLRHQFEPLYQMHFSSERKRMTTVIRYGDRLVTLVKGATEVLLEQTNQYLAADGTVRDWTPEAKAKVQEQVRAAAGDAMRTLAFGYTYLPNDMPTDEDSLHAQRDRLEQGLIFAGFVAIRDPLRDDVKDAVAKCRQAGIEVKMITGDNIETARAIGREIGLLDITDAVALTSAQFNEMSDDQLKAIMPRLRILARARPLDKYRMVKLLQEQNHVVAMTGDGTNDAPSLKKADVGLAMGIAGTEVAKEASKIVLLDDSFATIVKAVHWGRALYENIQRFVQFQLTINFSALVIAFLAPFLLGMDEPPFTVLQFLWINIIMDTFAAIALCSEPPRENLMRMKPKRKDESIVTPAMLGTILTTGTFFVVVMLSLLAGMQAKIAADGSKIPGWFSGPADGPDGGYLWSEKFELFTVYQLTVFFTMYVLFQVWNQINCRSLTTDMSGFKGLLENRMFLFISTLILVVQALIVNFGGEVFQVRPIGLMTWLMIAAGTFSVVIFAEITRQIRKMLDRPQPTAVV